mgnify:CR=1 FL=1
MILVMPLIKLAEGVGAIKIQCLPEFDEYFCRISEDPLLLVKLWRKENAKCVHIVDTDSFERNNNYLNSTAAVYIAESVDIPIEFSSEFSDIEVCRALLNSGIYRIVLNELTIVDPINVRKLVEEFTPSRVAFLCRLVQGMVYFPVSNLYYNISDYLKLIKSFGGDRIIFHDETSLSKNEDYSFNLIEQIGKTFGIKITLYEGISSSKSLIELKKLNTQYIDSTILGIPLYQNIFPCQNIWREAESQKISLFLED